MAHIHLRGLYKQDLSTLEGEEKSLLEEAIKLVWGYKPLYPYG